VQEKIWLTGRTLQAESARILKITNHNFQIQNKFQKANFEISNGA